MAHSLTSTEASRLGLAVNADGVRRSLFDLLSRPDVQFESLNAALPQLREFSRAAMSQIETDAKYSVYLARQEAAVSDYEARLGLHLPASLDYGAIPGLSNEIRSRLSEARPLSLEHAYRLEGMTPAAMTVLAGYAARAVK